MAAGSQLVCNGFPDLPPDYPAGKLGYKQASYLAVAAATAAIWRSAQGGGPVASTLSLQEAVISTVIQAANPNLYLWHGMVAERTGTGGLRYPVVGSGFGSFQQGRFEDGEIIFIDTPGVTYPTADGLWVTYMQSPHQPHLARLPGVVRRSHRRRPAPPRTLDRPGLPRRPPRPNVPVHQTLLRRPEPRPTRRPRPSQHRPGPPRPDRPRHRPRPTPAPARLLPPSRPPPAGTRPPAPPAPPTAPPPSTPPRAPHPPWASTAPPSSATWPASAATKSPA